MSYLLTGHSLPRGVEYRVSRDRDLFSGRELARVEYRFDSAKRRWWQKFLVVLDGETTIDYVLEHLDDLIDAHAQETGQRVGA